ASSLRFHLKQMPSGDDSDSWFFINLYDGAAHLVEHSVGTLSDTDLPINPLTNKIVFSIGKVGGNNLLLDDVSVITTSTPATKPQLTNVDAYYASGSGYTG